MSVINLHGLVSVVMPAYNAAATIKDSVWSVLNQTYKNIELLIVDDCSTDNTQIFLNELSGQDERIKLMRLGVNKGVAEARNVAIRAAKGKYIAFLDADDVWMPEKLERQLALMAEMNCFVSTCAYYRFRSLGDWIGLSSPPPIINYQLLLRGNSIGNLTGIYDCEFIGKIYQKSVPHEDYLMWLQIVSKAGNVHTVKDPLAAYRVSSTSISANKLKSVYWTWKIYRSHLALSVSHSIFLMLNYMIKAIFKRI